MLDLSGMTGKVTRCNISSSGWWLLHPLGLWINVNLGMLSQKQILQGMTCEKRSKWFDGISYLSLMRDQPRDLPLRLSSGRVQASDACQTWGIGGMYKFQDSIRCQSLMRRSIWCHLPHLSNFCYQNFDLWTEHFKIHVHFFKILWSMATCLGLSFSKVGASRV